MAEERSEETDVRMDGPPRGHETRDVNIGALFLIGSGLLAVVALVLVLVGVLGGVFSNTETVSRERMRRYPDENARTLPPEPRLQVSPSVELQRARAREDSILHSYGWIDREAQRVRIPIERAMDLLLERGFPTRPAAGSALPDSTMPAEDVDQ